MKKLTIQGLIILFSFFFTWFVLSQIDWVRVFKIQKATDKTEEKLGDMFWDIIKNSEKENKNTYVKNTIDSIVSKVCTSNAIERESIKIHIIEKDDINAFALPNGHLIVYSGLIENADRQEELCGVICHEMAHIQLKHVMKKLVKEMGLTVLISMSGGKSGSEIGKQTAKMLSSTAFDRSLEKDADIKAVDYLIQAKINPEPFADFLYKLSGKEHEATKYLNWISTHPDSKERAEYIIESCKSRKTNYQQILSNTAWNSLKEKLKN